jgi:hypothetical protein
MRILLRALIVIAAVTVVAGQSFAATKNEVTVQILSAEFGTFDATDPRESVFVPTNVVPHRTGQRYGWVITLRTNEHSLSVREEYLLPNARPAPKPDNPIAENLAVPLERHNQVSQRQLVPVNGKIYGEWEVGPNEPTGHRRLQVVVEDVVVARFDYEVE